MKTILVAALLSVQIFAQTYNFKAPQANVARTDEGYELVPAFSVDVKYVDVGRKEGVVHMTVNGETREYPAKVVKFEVEAPEITKTIQVLIKRDLLADEACGDYEAVSYLLSFDQSSEYGHYAVSNNFQLEAKAEYSWDPCHDSTQRTYYKYTRL